ncbi:COX15/CtaA family protein [Maribacter sp. 4G9]|uniref:COX15/CtaA family protein n=1 Tax=Maribacter sp. 4G9 TaxID=1889777 RepID=UPI000C151143|nr:COX15/CtaA family protein [Maribacter sp. 4G9]PIB26933.1 cytochrome oxidase assembly protein [Maribacter sp. 4G9]
MKASFRKLAKLTLILVYLVIVAGAVVRMTGSGMGCPDWPKCFGYYIPPTEASELEWQPERSYEKSQVIIKDETLRVAARDFTSANSFNEENWNLYTKHDYAIFNPWHTWIEYINRLLGALAGLATLVLAFSSITYWKKQKRVTILSWLVVFGMGFQAWLGATVVYSVLEPVKITLHMLMALLIVAMLLYIIFRVNNEDKRIIFDKTTLVLACFALILTIVQIILGTQVRQFVDHQIEMVGDNAKGFWLEDPTLVFYVHRSFSIIVILVNAFLAYRIFSMNLGHMKIVWILFLLVVEAFSGMAMYYLDFPFASQPLHLVVASILFGVQFYLVLDALKPKSSPNSL